MPDPLACSVVLAVSRAVLAPSRAQTTAAICGTVVDSQTFETIPLNGRRL